MLSEYMRWTTYGSYFRSLVYFPLREPNTFVREDLSPVLTRTARARVFLAACLLGAYDR